MPTHPNEKPQKAQKPEAAKQEKKSEYKPSAWVTQRVQEFPFKEDLKRIYGVDLEALLKEPKEFGILESIASSNFTLVPIEMKINKKQENIKECIDTSRGTDGFNEAEQRAALEKWIPDMGYRSGRFTMRLWYVPGTERWGVERHEVRYGKKLDVYGAAVKNDDGDEKLTFDVNRLRDCSAIKFNGDFLSKDQTDHLRLTGTLGGPIKHKFFNGKMGDVLLFVDDYNNHELITIDVKHNKRQLESRLGEKNKIYVEGQGDKVFSINKEDGSMSIAAAGGYIWVTNVKDKTEKINVWFDPRNRKFRPTIPSDPTLDFSMAHAREVSEKISEGQKAAETKTQTKTRGKSK